MLKVIYFQSRTHSHIATLSSFIFLMIVIHESVLIVTLIMNFIQILSLITIHYEYDYHYGLPNPIHLATVTNSYT